MNTKHDTQIDDLMPYQASNVNREDQVAEAMDAGVDPASFWDIAKTVGTGALKGALGSL